jgi:ribosomal 50S subunit-recycling heat shock protein
MRLDAFLKLSRLVLRRTVANQICNAGFVKVNGLRAKPSKEVREGDEIEINYLGKRLEVKIVSIPSNKQVSKRNASKLYEVLSEISLSDEEPRFEIVNAYKEEN